MALEPRILLSPMSGITVIPSSMYISTFSAVSSGISTSSSLPTKNGEESRGSFPKVDLWYEENGFLGGSSPGNEVCHLPDL